MRYLATHCGSVYLGPPSFHLSVSGDSGSSFVCLSTFLSFGSVWFVSLSAARSVCQFYRIMLNTRKVQRTRTGGGLI